MTGTLWRTAAAALLIAALTAPGTRPAAAAEWTVDHAQSRLAIRAAQGNQTFDGRFARFDAEIRFDPADPAAGRVAVTVDPASLDTGSPERDGLAAGAQWFDVRRFPRARFTTADIVPLGGDRYEARGELSIKEIARPVILPFALTIEGDTARVTGELALDRTAFGLGEGDFADPALVGHRVTVTVDLIARRAP